MKNDYREEKDSMGVVKVPMDSYYGAQTQRAADNFNISDLSLPFSFIRALCLIKKCAAKANIKLGIINEDHGKNIVNASDEILNGSLKNQFIVDLFQTGSGTSTNMNANEVIAGRANEIMTGKRGGKSPIHPNDHVNAGQSSNDVIPTAIHVSALYEIKNQLIPSLKLLQASLEKKAKEFQRTRKIGRTHLQDAVPMSLGQEFSGYARQIELGIKRVNSVEGSLAEIALGGTAVGTGLNTHKKFAQMTISMISDETGINFSEAKNHFEAQATQDASVETSAALKTIAVSLIKIANDIRWLSSGPRCGLGEITIPSLQPGSSIMPGKINPVIPEVVLQVAAQVIGNDTTITFSGQAGNFELNVMLPVIAYNLLQSINILSSAVTQFVEKCINSISANEKKCASYIEKSLALCTGLVPAIGYDMAAEVAKEAFNSGKTVREIALERKLLPDKEIKRLLDDMVAGK